MYDRIGKWKVIWHFTDIGDEPPYFFGWRRGSVGLIKVLQRPPRGEQLSRKYYRGKVITFRFFWPIVRGY